MKKYILTVWVILMCAVSIRAQEENVDSICELAETHALMGDWDWAIDACNELYMQFYDTRKNTLGFAKCADYLGRYYSGRGNGISDFNYAVNLSQEALAIYPKTNYEYVSCVNNIAFYYVQIQDYKRAQIYVNDGIKSLTQFYAQDNSKAAVELKRYADRIAAWGHYPTSILYSEAYFKLMESSKMTNNVEYVEEIFSVASYYNNERNYEKELELLYKVEPIIKNLFSDQSGEYLHCVNMISIANNLIRNDSEYQKWESVARKILVDNGHYDAVNIDQTPLYSNMSKQYASERNYVEAIKNEEISLNIYYSHGDSVSMAKSYNNISNYYYYDNDIDNALTYCARAIDIYKKKSVISVNCALAFNNMSIYKNQLEDTKSALMYAKKSADIFKETGDTLNELYSKVLMNVATYSVKVGNTEEALKYSHMTSKVTPDNIGEIDGQDITMLYNEAMIAYNSGDVEKTMPAYRNLMNVLIESISKNYDTMLPDQKTEYWKKNKSAFDKATSFAYKFNTNDSIIADAYGALLFARQIAMGKNAKDIIKVQDIKSSLKDGEMSIEFFTLKTSNLGNAYAAFCLKHGWSTPKCIKLFVNKDLQNVKYIDDNDFFQKVETPEGLKEVFSDTRVGELVWKKLLPDMEDTKKVYIIPTELINSFAIEDLACEFDYNKNEGIPLSNKISFVRIASVLQLAIDNIVPMEITGTPLIVKDKK